MSRAPITALAAAYSLFAQIPAPRNLHATVATNRSVRLAWTASPGPAGYTVERKPLGGKQYTALQAQPEAAAEATDSSIDAFTTYVYRVKAVNEAKQSSAPSNEITVGPPPVGLSLVVATPQGIQDPDYDFAQVPQMILDENGDPAISYYDIKGDHGAGSVLYFVSWDRAAYHWRAPVEVATVGPVDTTRPAMPFSLARDAGTNTFGIAYPANRRGGSSRAVALAVSSDVGASWQVKTVAAGAEARFGAAALALGGGQAYVAWEQDNGIVYANGKLTDDPASWTKTNLPSPVTKRPRLWFPTLALDGDGIPGLVFVAVSADDYNSMAVFWRPGEAPMKVMDSNNIQNDHPKVRIDFSGTKPRLVAEITRTPADPRTGWPPPVWFVAAQDGGKVWGQPVPIPWDGATRMGRPEIAVGSRDQAAVVMDMTGGSGGDTCGDPKLARSSDLVQWKTCSPLGSGKPKLRHSTSAVIRYAANGKLYIAMVNPTADTYDAPAPVGLILWREP